MRALPKERPRERGRTLLRRLLLPQAYPLVGVTLASALVLLAAGHPRWVAFWLIAGAGAAWALGHCCAARERQLWSLCSTDPATGLANRRQFHQCIERELAQMFRSRRPLALLLFDLDHLKAINDRHGHAAGDAAIRAVAAAFKSCCRAGDLIARWGGDEFAVVASCATKNEAVALADRLCLAVREHPLRCGATPTRLSVSGGVTLADPDRATASRPSALFAAADRALYRAKARGGDRVELARVELMHAREAEADDVTLVPLGPQAREVRRWHG